mgnify:CR=1 FL=1
MKFNKKIFFQDLFERLKKNLYPKVDLHVHTKWTDGENTVSEMYNEAENKSLEAIFFSEHSRKESGKWFFDFCEEINKLPPKTCIPIVGTEVKVLNLNGDLDFNGPNALAASTKIGLDNELDNTFLNEYCPKVVEGTARMKEWLS